MKRSLTVEWQDPGPLADAARTMSGIDFLRAICDGKLAQPPICHLLGYRLVEVEPAIHVGSRVGTAEGRLEDVSGKLYAHATTTCMVLANGR